ncbi:MAG TPA: hypothetical protein VKQ71_06725, partial [Acidimicrobiales bacterium]|nr:hypothetical protein [Acidimicrobiales bacterium]
IRNKLTVVNRQYGPDSAHVAGWSDGQIVRDLYLTYRPDIDVTNVATLVAAGSMPSISFPTHTLEQMLARIEKISTGYHRVDYYKRLWYNALGALAAPFGVSDTPNPVGNPPTYAAENVRYGADQSNLVDRIWVVGGTYQVNDPGYSFVCPGSPTFAFPLPTRLQNVKTVTVQRSDKAGTAEVVGVLGVDGTLDNIGGWKAGVTCLIGSVPPTIAFNTVPAAGVTVTISAILQYQLVQVVTDASKQALVNGLIFEKVVKDVRIDSVGMATQVATAHLNLYGTGKKSGTMTLKYRAAGGALLQPGQTIPITNVGLFTGVLSGGATTLQALITGLRTSLTEDTSQPYELEVEFSDRPDLADDDLMDQLIGEQGRLNAALTQTDINALVTDFKTAADTVGFQAEALAETTHATLYAYDAAGVAYNFATYA